MSTEPGDIECGQQDEAARTEAVRAALREHIAAFGYTAVVAATDMSWHRVERFAAGSLDIPDPYIGYIATAIGFGRQEG